MLTETYILKKYGLLLTVEQVAEIFHKAPGTVENQIAQGRFPVSPIEERKVGKKQLFHYAAVARAIDATDDALGQSTPA